VEQKKAATLQYHSESYSNRELKTNCWTKIRAEMYPDWNEMANVVKNEKGLYVTRILFLCSEK
jgi:hypothetical protein